MNSPSLRTTLVATAVLFVPILILSLLQLVPMTAGTPEPAGAAVALPDPDNTLAAATSIPHIPASMVLSDSETSAVPGNPKARYLASPLHFEANAGQTDKRVKFMARGSGYGLFLANDEVVLALHRSESGKKAPHARQAKQAGRPAGAVESEVTVLRTRFAGANPAPEVVGIERRETQLNYLIGNEPSRWSRGAQCYGRVLYRAVYPGIDLVFYGNQRQLEYDFIVSPGADPGRIRMKFQGAERVGIDPQGNLVLGTAAGELRQHKPRLSQIVAGLRREVKGRFAVRGDSEVAFEVGDYDRTQALTIDPIFSYYTVLGGSGDDRIFATAADQAGNIYVAGETTSANFPTTSGSYKTSFAGGSKDVFVAKLNKTVTSLLYSTYVGGSGADSAAGIGVDTFGNVYVTGSTDSSNFPTTTNSYQAAKKGLTDVFFFRLSPTGDSLLNSTFLGGQGTDTAAALYLEPSGRVFITGTTDSDDFPVAAGAYQTARKGKRDAFVARFGPLGALLASSYLGGSGDEDALAMTATAGGLVYLGGQTASTDLPVTADAAQAANKGGAFDGFITVLGVGAGSTAGLDPGSVSTVRDGDMRLLYSTFLGGSGTDWVSGIAVGPDAGIYAGGTTNSADFPVTEGVNVRGGLDVFLARFPGVAGSIPRTPLEPAPGPAAEPSLEPNSGPAKKIVTLAGTADDTMYAMWFANTYLGILVDTYTPNYLNVSLYNSPTEVYIVQGIFDRALNRVTSVGQYGLDSASSRSGGMSYEIDSAGIYMGGRMGLGFSSPPPTGYQRSYGGGANDGFIAVTPPPTPLPDSMPVLQSAPFTNVVGATPVTTYWSGYSNINYYPRQIISTAVTRDAAGKNYSDTSFSGSFPVILKPNQQQVYLPYQKTGSWFNSQTRTGSIQYLTPGTLVGMQLTWNDPLTELDGAPTARTPMNEAVISSTDTLSSAYNNLFLHNPGSQAAKTYVQIIGSGGTSGPPAILTVPPQGSTSLRINADAFRDPAAGSAAPGKSAAVTVPWGYVRIRSSGGLVSFMNFGRSNQYLATLAGQDVNEGGVKLYSPQYVVGSGYTSHLSLVNLDGISGKAAVQLIKDDGTPWASPTQLLLGPYERIVITNPKFFVDPGTGLVQGYLSITSDGPRLAGSIFFGDPDLKNFGTALPLIASLMNRIIFAQLASDASWYTGMALLNPNATTATALIEVYESAGGNPKYTKTETIPAGSRKINVMTGFFPAMVGVNFSSGYITVKSNLGLAGFALYGTNRQDVLSAVAGQRLP